MATPIVRIAAKGDGVTQDGQHFPGTVTGDIVEADGTVVPGPHRAVPPCRHFGRCGGCQLQHVDEAAWRAFVTARVVDAAAGQGLTADNVLDTHCSPPATRRRATYHASVGKRAKIGFRERGGHTIIDQRECLILLPALQALVAPLRQLLTKFSDRNTVDIDLVMADQGIACVLRKLALEGLDETQRLIDFAQDHRLARLTVDQGYGPEVQWEPEPVTVTLGGVPVPLPDGAFLQPTADGEAAMLRDAREWLADSATVADLFAGLGTFAFALSDQAKVLAVEASRDVSLACRMAARSRARQVQTAHRDLFRDPLTAAELAKLDAVVLDPPRAGAKTQCRELAQSAVERIVYVSCNPSSWARDARTLVDGGYRLAALRPIGQFRWSTHVELTSLFVR
ncbi:MAG: class I SAM-dependent RNA methyltransferase [Parerythrobacter sp.]